MKNFILKNFGNAILNYKDFLANKYGFLMMQPIFVEASSFHSDTRGGHSSTFILEGTQPPEKEFMPEYLPIVFVALQ